MTTKRLKKTKVIRKKKTGGISTSHLPESNEEFINEQMSEMEIKYEKNKNSTKAKVDEDKDIERKSRKLRADKRA